jgi:fructose-1,6-bisphosphatase I
MADRPDLAEVLAPWAEGNERCTAARDAILAVAGVCAEMQARIAGGALVADHGALVGDSLDGDGQKALDQWADIAIIAALEAAGVGAVASEERPEAVVFDASTGGIVVAMDPLDGSSNIATNGSIGTIFSVLPDIGGTASFLQPGSAQIAAGYVIFGPYCALALTVGNGTQMFVLDPADRRFKLTELDVRIPPRTKEFAINSSNYRHWGSSVRAYFDDCISGREGPRGDDTNTRWVAAMVADAHRILTRGGVYLYPRDNRVGYEKGRLRLLYEASPIAFLIEQAGGKAFDGRTRILDIVPTDIHQRIGLIFGSADEIDRIARYKSDPNFVVARAPLFHRRGLFKGH